MIWIKTAITLYKLYFWSIKLFSSWNEHLHCVLDFDNLIHNVIRHIIGCFEQLQGIFFERAEYENVESPTLANPDQPKWKFDLSVQAWNAMKCLSTVLKSHSDSQSIPSPLLLFSCLFWHQDSLFFNNVPSSLTVLVQGSLMTGVDEISVFFRWFDYFAWAWPDLASLLSSFLQNLTVFSSFNGYLVICNQLLKADSCFL